MPEVNSESLVNRLLRENELLGKHCDSWSKDYKSLAAKLDRAESLLADVRAFLASIEWSDNTSETDAANLVEAISDLFFEDRPVQAAAEPRP